VKYDAAKPSDAADWRCSKCDMPLSMRKVSVAYLGSSFPVDLPRCPKCGQTYITEEMALVTMAEVEKLLEDK
jgi:NAD-dependent SIR2 family protein deacetylase